MMERILCREPTYKLQRVKSDTFQLQLDGVFAIPKLDMDQPNVSLW